MTQLLLVLEIRYLTVGVKSYLNKHLFIDMVYILNLIKTQPQHSRCVHH